MKLKRIHQSSSNYILNKISNKALKSIVYFFLAGLFEIGGGYLIWLWIREDMSWLLGVLGGFILFFYGIIPTLQSSHFHRIYAAYGGVFIVMAMLWGCVFEHIRPDNFDLLGAGIALFGVMIIYYWPRSGEQVL